jgi:Ca-activated chloride channel family protein
MMNVQDLFPGIVPRGGTNLQAALEKAMESFDPASEVDKVILLITDGEAHEGNLDPVLNQLHQENIRVFAVGVGTPEGSLIPMGQHEGKFMQNRNQEVVKSRLDEATLRKLASATDGLYVRANPRDFGVTELIEEGLKPLKRAQLETERIRELEERFQLFLGAGLICLLLEGLARLPGWWMTRRAT